MMNKTSTHTHSPRQRWMKQQAEREGQEGGDSKMGWGDRGNIRKPWEVGNWMQPCKSLGDELWGRCPSMFKGLKQNEVWVSAEQKKEWNGWEGSGEQEVWAEPLLGSKNEGLVSQERFEPKRVLIWLSFRKITLVTVEKSLENKWEEMSKCLIHHFSPWSKWIYTNLLFFPGLIYTANNLSTQSLPMSNF